MLEEEIVVALESLDRGRIDPEGGAESADEDVVHHGLVGCAVAQFESEASLARLEVDGVLQDAVARH